MYVNVNNRGHWRGVTHGSACHRAESLQPSIMSLADVTANLRAPVESRVESKPMVKVHAVEWAKVMAGEPVEINPSVGHGYKVMSVKEWAARWKPNEAYPDCLNCGSHSTKEHHFTQVTWWRQRLWKMLVQIKRAY